jgi:hypothetical protein
MLWAQLKVVESEDILTRFLDGAENVKNFLLRAPRYNGHILTCRERGLSDLRKRAFVGAAQVKYS